MPSSKKLKKQEVHTEFREGHGYSKADWDAVDSPEITEADFAAGKSARDVLPPEFFAGMEELKRARGRPMVEHPRKLVSIRLDQDLIDKLKSGGKGWQTRLNATLRKAVGL